MFRFLTFATVPNSRNYFLLRSSPLHNVCIRNATGIFKFSYTYSLETFLWRLHLFSCRSICSVQSNMKAINEATAENTVKIKCIGFGSYRVSQHIPAQKNALAFAIKNGIRLIDTSSNYCDGESEEVIGEVLQELIETEKSVKREEIHIVSKFGYLSGQDLARYENGQKYPDIVEFNPQFIHCIHPEFMSDQLERSLKSLKLDYIDCYLVHNPEYYITKNIPKFRRADTENDIAVLNEMYRRIELVFERLENEVTGSGKIKAYGVSSNSFSLAPDDPHFLSYEEILKIAQRIGLRLYGDKNKHHFTTIELPANLIEREALTHAVIWAKEKCIRTLINRPLNAFLDKGSWRLADYPNMREEFCKCSEELKEEHLGPKTQKIKELLQEMEQLVSGEFNMTFFEWEAYKEGYVFPVVRKIVMEDRLEMNSKALDKLQDWLDILDGLGKHKSGVYTRNYLKGKLLFDIPDNVPLQEFALKYLLQSKGVTHVLLGARKIEYVEDALRVIKDCSG